jgi:hypothetical protein
MINILPAYLLPCMQPTAAMEGIALTFGTWYKNSDFNFGFPKSKS